MDRFVCKEDYPVVETKAGKLRGYVWNDTFIFKGIKYADAERFMRPREIAPWEGVKDAQSYGYVCPLMEQDHPSMELMVPHMYWPMDEHCQYLNVWTQSIDPQAKRPVMVWLHGGGFFAGSSIEQLAYDGENMSKYGDVVVVSLNHRLNILGYLDLSPFGERYAESANVGSLDMIMALRWIRDNIAGFGGDPDNVTLFGQSGGGAKVWTLMQMPEADGLFHRGIVESGVYAVGGMGDVEEQDGTQIVGAMLEELGLTAAEVGKLETLPYAALAEAYRKVAPAIAAQGGYVGNKPHIGSLYAGDPVRHGFREHAKQIPLLIGTALGEFDFLPPVAKKWELTREQVLEKAGKRYGDKAEQVLALFEQAYPGKCLLDAMVVDTVFRAPTIAFIRERAKSAESVTYSYQFTYEFPIYNGKVAWHCSEIPFVFHNIDKVPICNKDEGSLRLQEQICGAWINFAREGSPNIEGVEWPCCQAGDEAVMILDETCEIRHNVDHALIELLESLPKPGEEERGAVQH